MNLRNFGGDPVRVSDVGVGTWQFGGTEWGNLAETDAVATLRAATDAGITFLDTADIYGLGRSERIIGGFLRETPSYKPFVATKLGKNPDPGGDANFTLASFRKHTEASLQRLGVEALDLQQMHCVPLEQLQRGDVFDWLRTLQREGKITRWGASVESDEEAKACLAQDGLASLQIIFNIYRQKPIADLFDEAKRKGVAIIVRLPLASGLLSGRYKKTTTFAPTDHRTFNRNGEKFNVGETFAGLPFERGVELTEELKAIMPPGDMAQWALRWCLDFDAVTVVIPGARNPEQARSNAAASDLAPLPADTHRKLREFYERNVAALIRGPY
jgi:aryl-alcohol dehydrogenase-like predicted oxidoreductase